MSIAQPKHLPSHSKGGLTFTFFYLQELLSNSPGPIHPANQHHTPLIVEEDILIARARLQSIECL